MARAIHCDADDGQQAVWLVTNLNDGTAFGMCQQHMSEFANLVCEHNVDTEPERPPDEHKSDEETNLSKTPSNWEYDAPEGTKSSKNGNADDGRTDNRVQHGDSASQEAGHSESDSYQGHGSPGRNVDSPATERT